MKHLLGLFLLVILLIPRTGETQTCGSTFSGVLTQPIGPCPEHGLRVPSGGTLDCAGHRITGLGDGSEQYGVYLDGVTQATVTGCDISGFLRGVRVKGTDNRVLGNVIHRNGLPHPEEATCGTGYGIDLASAPSGTVIVGNTIVLNGDEGIHVGSGASGTLIDGNRVHSNDCEAVYLLESTGTIVQWNQLGLASVPSKAAVYHKHAASSLIRYNEINGQVIHVVGNSTGVTLQGNERPDGSAAIVNLGCLDGACPPSPTMLPRRYTDVPTHHVFARWIETIAAHGITSGCAPGMYCPDGSVAREQMAVFLLRGMHGSSYVPPDPTGGVFSDVPVLHAFARWIEQLAVEGITAGCALGVFCPSHVVSRDQMAVFLLRAKYGAGYAPPVATGTVFTDVPAGYWAAAWIEQLAREGITGGCGVGVYCPGAPVTRGQMAVFLTRAFAL